MESEKATLKVRILQGTLTHSGKVYPNGGETELPESTAKGLALGGIVEILSTIVEPVVVEPVVEQAVKPDEAASSGEAAQTSGEATEEAPATAKTASKKGATVSE